MNDPQKGVPPTQALVEGGEGPVGGVSKGRIFLVTINGGIESGRIYDEGVKIGIPPRRVQLIT